MSKETPAQKKMREHYAKIFKDRMGKGPIDHSELDEQTKDWYSWNWCQIDHVCMAMGGFANFRYFLTEQAENRFRLTEKILEENQKLIAACRTLLEMTEGLDCFDEEEDIEFVNHVKELCSI